MRSDTQTRRLGIGSHESWIVPTPRPPGLRDFKGVIPLQAILKSVVDFLPLSRMGIASETQAEPTRRRRGELLFWVLVAKAAFAASTRSSSGGGPTDTDSAVITGCDAS